MCIRKLWSGRDAWNPTHRSHYCVDCEIWTKYDYSRTANDRAQKRKDHFLWATANIKRWPENSIYVSSAWRLFFSQLREQRVGMLVDTCGNLHTTVLNRLPINILRFTGESICALLRIIFNGLGRKFLDPFLLSIHWHTFSNREFWFNCIQHCDLLSVVNCNIISTPEMQMRLFFGNCI